MHCAQMNYSFYLELILPERVNYTVVAENCG